MELPHPSAVRTTPSRRFGSATAGLVACLLGWGLPAAALERVDIKLPLLSTSLSLNLSELRDPQRLISGSSDLAELDRATDGAIGRRITAFFNTPLPLSARVFADKAVGSPLVNQALMIVSALVQVDGLSENLDSTQLSVALDRLNLDATKGSLTVLDVLQAIPGTSATVDLEKALFAVKRLASQQRQGMDLVASLPPTGSGAELRAGGPLAVQRSDVALLVSHRPQPLSVVVLAPRSGANGRLVVISHGLWDSPENFEGWGTHLASHGYTVLLPRHPGSDSNQQRAMLEGKVPPPSPDDLRLRPLDVSAAIDGVAAGTIRLPSPVRTDAVVALGHSWGATTVLQLAGARPSVGRIDRFCSDPSDPARNLSWVLQCSFRSSADRAVAPDLRVRAVVAVSPMMSLLFDVGSSQGMNGRVLVVSGSRDWVVPSGPEALTPMAGQSRGVGGGHRLVLVRGGDHFNLRSPQADAGGPLRGLLLGWVNGAFAAGPAAAPAPGAPSLLPPTGWGDPEYPLVDVTASLGALAGR